MSIQFAKIAKGVWGGLRKQKKGGQFANISWFREKILKHEEDKNIKTTTFGRIKLSYQRPYEVLHTYKELFEEELYKFISDNPTPFVVDCGANIGLSVLYFKQLYPNATILAYEPDKDNFALLQTNVAQNALKNVECRQKAVWVHNGTIAFSSVGSQGSRIAQGDFIQNKTEIAAERLADVLKEKRVDLLKIDIEGAEVDVLTDCVPYLDNVQQLFVEYHGKAEETEKLTQLLNILKSRYKVYIKLAADELKHPFIEKSTGGSFDLQLNIFCYP